MAITAEQLDKVMPSAAELLSDEPEMESSLHSTQLMLLHETLDWLWQERDDYFLGANLTVYFSREQLVRPEIFGGQIFLSCKVWLNIRATPGWSGKKVGGILMSSWNCCQVRPKTLIEPSRLTSMPNAFVPPEYFWYSPQTDEFQGLRLRSTEYEEIAPNENGWRWSEELQLYLGVFNHQLRYFHPNGELVPTVQEAARLERQKAQQEAQRADQETQRAEQEAKRATRLAAKLREMGINPDEI